MFVVFLDVECLYFRYLLMENCEVVKTAVEGVMANCCADGTYYVQSGEVLSLAETGSEECPLILQKAKNDVDVWHLLLAGGLFAVLLALCWKCWGKCCRKERVGDAAEEVEEDVV